MNICDEVISPKSMKSERLTCRKILRYLPYSTEQNAIHGNQGKIVYKEGSHEYKIETPLEVRGKCIQQHQNRISPESYRKQKVKDKIWDKLQPDTATAAESYAAYPPTKRMHEHILNKCGIEESSKYSKIFHDELSKEFSAWNKNTQNLQHNGDIQEKYPQYRGIPPWRGASCDNNLINGKLRISMRIIGEFFHKFRSQSIFDPEEFLQAENGTAVEIFKQQIDEFLKRARQTLAFEWVISVGRLMLDEKDVWVNMIADGTVMGYFNAVAATMSRLLYDVVQENIDRLNNSLNMGGPRLRMLMRNETELLRISDLALEFVKLAKIPRVEHKLYPNMFKESFIDVSEWFITIRTEVQLSTVPCRFTEIDNQLKALDVRREEYFTNQENYLLWKEIVKSLLGLRSKALNILPTEQFGVVVYNRSFIRANTINKIEEFLEKMKYDILKWQAARNDEIQTIFCECSSNLYGKDVLTQLRHIGDVQKALAVLNQRIQQAHLVYSSVLEYFILPDSSLRHYYEISRIRLKLTKLTKIVWERIETEREWVIKKVTDKTAANYFEGEMIEKEFDSCMKRYRVAVKISEIQRIAAKFKVLTERSKTLLQQDEDLIGQRQLLELPAFSINIHRLVVNSEYFADIATLHYKTLHHEQNVVQAHVLDINLTEVTALTEELLDIQKQLDAQMNSIEERHLSLLEYINNNISTILQKLASILPVLTALLSQGMKEKHWQQILSDLQPGVEIQGNPLVGDLLAMNLTDEALKFDEITTLAEEEKGLENFISTMKKQWEEATFDVKQPSYLSTELTSQMTSHIARSHQIIASPYAFTILEQIKHWLDTLIQLHLFIDLHKQCDTRWKKIEGVFSTEDIAYQMPAEFRIFKKITVLWNTVNNRITGSRSILEQMDDVKEVNLILQEMRDEFAKLEVGFNAYLRKKRLVFPRFFVLSDAQLLDLLAKSKDPSSIISFIPKLFAGIHRFVQNSRGEIVSFVTASCEVKLGKMVNVNASKRHIEKWLSELDREICQTVKGKLKTLLERHKFQIVDVGEMIAEPVQIALLYYKIAMTNQIETAIRHKTLKNLMEQLLKHLESVMRQLQEQTTNRRNMEEFAIFFYKWTHQIKVMIDRNMAYVDDLEWTSKIRYYWHMEHVFVRVHFSSTPYDYHYTTGSENVSSTSLIEIGQLMVRSRLGLPSYVNDLSTVTSLAKCLGRTVTLSSSDSRSQPMLEGSLLLGSILLTEYNSETGSLAGNISHNMDIGSFKYVTENEITINPSFTVTFPRSKSTKVSVTKFSSQLKQLLRIYGFEEANKICKRFSSLIKLFRLFFNICIAMDPLLSSLIDEFSTLKQNTNLTELQICDCVLKKYFLLSLREIQRNNMLALLYNLPKEYRETEEYSLRKVKEVGPHKAINLILSTCNCLIVVGESLTGKTELIRRAAEHEGNDVTLIGFSDMDEITNNIQTTKPRWLLYDGRLLECTISWLQQKISEPTLNMTSSLPNLPENIKLLIETDQEVPPSLTSLIPVVTVESQWKPRRCLDKIPDAKLELLGKLEGHFDGFPSRLFFHRLQRLSEHFHLVNDLSFTSIVFVCLQSLLDHQEFKEVWSGTGFSTEDVLSKFHTQNDFINLVELQENTGISCGLQFAIYWTELLLRLSFIPLLITNFPFDEPLLLKSMIDHLTRIFLSPIALTITPETTLENILEFMETCNILFANENKNDTGSVLILIGAQFASPELFEYLRTNQNKNQFKFILVSTTDLPDGPNRLRKYLFKIPYTERSGNRDLKYQLQECMNSDNIYHTTIKQIMKINKDDPIKNCSQIVENQLFIQLRTLANYDGKYKNFTDQIMSEESPEESENASECKADSKQLLDIYNDHEEETSIKLGYRQCNRIHLTEETALYLMTIEKLFELPGKITLLPGWDVKQVKNIVRIASERCQLSTIYFDNSPKKQEWKSCIEQILNVCLINGNNTLLVVDFFKLTDAQSFDNIASEVFSLVSQSIVPIHYLTRGFIADFSEKHTMEGRGVWEKLSNMLAQKLRVCFILEKDMSSEFLILEKEFVYSSLILFQPQTSQQQNNQIIRAVLNDGDVLSQNEIMDVLKKFNEFQNLQPNVDFPRVAEIFVHLMKKQKNHVKAARARYEKGMDKLRYAQEQTNHLQTELLRLQPELLRTSIETSILMSKIERETIEVENAREVVAANENKANQAATKAQTLKAESEADLASAIPALEAAIESLSTMTQSDVSALKTMRFPPYGVRLCMEAVCILLGVKPAKIMDSLGGATEDYWIPGQKLLSDIHFLSKIRSYPRDKIPSKTMRIIREKYLAKEEFDPENVKQCSLAAEGLCLWVKAIELYNRISKFVEPKKEKLRKAEIFVKQHMKRLDAKRKSLQEVTEKLQSLSDQFSQMSQRKQELQSQMTSCEMRMERAERLVHALGGEKHKWLSKIEEIDAESDLLTQTCLITAIALLAYGNLNEFERKNAVQIMEKQIFPACTAFTDVSNEHLMQWSDLPVVIFNDPGEDGHLVQHLYRSQGLIMDNFMDELKMCMIDGTVFLGIFNEITEGLANQQMYLRGEKRITFLNNEEIQVADGFRMILYNSHEITDNYNILRINFGFSKDDINKAIGKALGRSNWPTHLEDYNNSVAMIEKTKQWLEDMDIGMLDMLGSKDGLDDERAIELLAETHEIQKKLMILNTEGDLLKTKLKHLEAKFQPMIEWATNLTQILHRLGEMTPFQRYSIQKLIANCEINLSENIEEINDFVTSRCITKITEHVWSVMSHSLNPSSQVVLRYCMDRRLMIGQFSRCGFKDFQRFVRSFKVDNQFKTLGTNIWRSNPTDPVFVLSDELNSSWIYYIKDISKNVKLVFWPVNAMLKELVSKILDEPTWVVVSLTDWTDIKSNAVQNVIRFLRTQQVHCNFRLILTKRGDDAMPMEISRYVGRFSLQSQASLANLLETTVEYSAFKATYQVYNDACKRQFLQLIILFYSIYLRFPHYTGIDLHFSLKAYMECHRSSSDNSEISIKTIRTAVFQPILANKLENDYEVSIANTIFQWIFEGVSRADDIVLKNILGNQWSEAAILEKLALSMPFNERTLCGLSPDLINLKEEANETKLFNLTQKVLGGNKATMDLIVKREEKCCMELPPARKELSVWVAIWNELKEEMEKAIPSNSNSQYLLKLLKEVDNTRQINVSFIANPLRLFYAMRVELAVAQNICISQTALEGSVQVFEKGDPPYLISNCLLQGAQLERFGDLTELTAGKRCHSPVSLYVRAVKITSAKGNNNYKTIPLLTRDKEAICDIRVRTTHPVCHWILRGAHFTTTENREYNII